QQYPIFFLNFIMTTGTRSQSNYLSYYSFLRKIIPSNNITKIYDLDSYDVNVTPDKRTLYIHDENNFIEAIKVTCSLGPQSLLKMKLQLPNVIFPFAVHFCPTLCSR